MYLRRQFLKHIAQTSEIPQGFEIDMARDSYLYDRNGDKYLDLISGFGVSNIGHGIPEVQKAIQEQSEKYLHSNVYGEHIQGPQLELATYLSSFLPENLQSFYFLNSGSECIDAAIKLARLYSGHREIIVCKNAYHGSTLGAESLRSDESHTSVFRPLLPGIRFIRFNELSDLEFIRHKTAAVFTEVVQAEAGIRIAGNDYWNALRKRCNDTHTLLVLDEIQTGIGRTGKLFAFQHTNISPDILLSGKALGAGMPLSALITSLQIMQSFHQQLALAHITTFGGHPVCCAAGLAGLRYMLENKILDQLNKKVTLFKELLKNPHIKEIRNCGLFFALELQSSDKVMYWIQKLFEQKIIVESFLFCPTALRIAPPLKIPDEEIERVCNLINALK